ncbi:hypothetical protein [Pseudorhodoplanes sinuspersici]|uniref:Uncharacterized protein n=1 Tax=Pseudorhodoplanes sinuspersici TaxID=1235591 RepID=A0A1W6ZKI0_9HYPH|nr:hypothetical protein [Pseudorhodoplanes sinuspersici]ARP97755.1 hypothetical protein CAK95_00675 [Pseudorhodoplanes sinuspersici]RKE68520.1 hypothetical protein DFP91_4910 [Pseudorhodoplanes sinuspersici]
MSIIRTVIIAASFVAVAATANAQGREELNSGIHGNSPVVYGSAISAEARGAFARAGGAAGTRMHDANPLVDNFHGN